MTKLKISMAGAALAVPLLLSGCSADGYGIKALEATAGPEDVLPDGVNVNAVGDFDRTTVRLLVEDDGRKYYGGQNTDGSEACVAVVPENHEWYVGCGALTSADNRIITVSGPDGKPVALVRDNADAERLESEGLRRIHQNLYVAG